MKTDWNKIKKEYLAGKKPADICKKYKVNYNTFDTHRKSGQWTALKRKTNENITKKIEEKEVEKALFQRDEMAKDWHELARLRNQIPIRNASDFNAVVTATAKIQDGLFDCYGIKKNDNKTDQLTQININIEQDRSKL